MIKTYDSVYDILYIKFKEVEKVISKEFDKNIILDFDEEGKLVGIEILFASQSLNLKDLLPAKYEIYTALGVR